MPLAVLKSCESFVAHTALVWFAAGVYRLMTLDVTETTETFTANRTREWFLRQVIFIVCWTAMAGGSVTVAVTTTHNVHLNLGSRTR